MTKQSFATSPQSKTALLELAFRPLFLFGALFSSLAIAIWLLNIHGIISKDLYGGSYFWHAHEMLFGFVAAMIVGFLLTAVQNWTAIRSVNGRPLAALFFLWLIARIGFLVIEESNIWLAIIDVSFLVIAAIFLAIPIIKIKQWRNLSFIPIVIIFSICNAMMHIGVITQNYILVNQGTQSALLLVALLMTIIGGRVIPFFTANRTKTTPIATITIIEQLSIGSIAILMLIFLLLLDKLLADRIIASLFALAAISQLIRWSRWRFLTTLRIPLLWSLHLSYLFIISAFLVLSLHFYGLDIGLFIGWHLLTIGGMGALILSMISRVSLGHTGRMIIAPRWMIPAFIFIFISAIVRTLPLIILPQYYLSYITISGILWIIAFLIFAIGYFAILIQPRIDNS